MEFLKQVEAALLPFAVDFIGNDEGARALTHQWAHAVAFNSGLVGAPDEKKIVQILKSAGLYDSRAKFCDDLTAEIAFPPKKIQSFKFIDLFAGIGGFRLGLQNIGGQCVFSSEWDRPAAETYYRNYGELPFGDIRKFSSESVSDDEIKKLIPDHEVLAAGFPCQPFSHAGVSARTAVGKEHGFRCNTQGTLFFDIMRIAAVKKPKVLFLENVKNIQRHDGGRTFEIIRESIEDLGYNFDFRIIDASTMVPQRRHRCYMVCVRKDLDKKFEFPKFEGAPLALKSILEKAPDPAFTISDKLWAGHIQRTERNLSRGTGFTAFTADLDKPSNTLVARYGKDGKECLIPQQGKNPRFLTPRECARLQGYPDDFILPKAKTPAYKQFGNSVAVPIVSELAKSIYKVIK